MLTTAAGELKQPLVSCRTFDSCEKMAPKRKDAIQAAKLRDIGVSYRAAISECNLARLVSVCKSQPDIVPLILDLVQQGFLSTKRAVRPCQDQ